MFRIYLPKTKEVECAICHQSSKYVSEKLRVCIECIRGKPRQALALGKKAHEKSRLKFNLPSSPPNNKDGALCKICANTCRIEEGGRGFCGLRTNKGGKINHLAGIPSSGVLEWYYDPLPTNCVADWVCPGGCGSGYPEFSHNDGEPEFGYKNLAVFYGACTFDCLFCQNWHYRLQSKELSPQMSAQELAANVDEKTSCICFFGGDPTAQLPHAIKTSHIAKRKATDRILRICWETNGTMMPSFLKTMAKISLKTGGCIKIDLKTWDENLNLALCGASNTRTKKNIEYLVGHGRQRKNPPFLVVSTLLVPGYVDAQEVGNIAKFLSSLDKEIPYSLLGFHPDFEMDDMPTTSKKEAFECEKVAREEGLVNVRIGNIHLLV